MLDKWKDICEKKHMHFDDKLKEEILKKIISDYAERQ